jgi:hypothetical protein
MEAVAVTVTPTGKTHRETMTEKSKQVIVAAMSVASNDRLWGSVSVEFKDGVPYLIKTTKQNRIEDAPYVNAPQAR